MTKCSNLIFHLYVIFLIWTIKLNQYTIKIFESTLADMRHVDIYHMTTDKKFFFKKSLICSLFTKTHSTAPLPIDNMDFAVFATRIIGLDTPNYLKDIMLLQ